MAKKEGEVRIPSVDRKFGFVENAFISGRDLNSLNLQGGDRVSYDEVPGQAGKGPKATNINVVARAAAPATQTGPPVQTAETTVSPVPAKQEKMSVEFMVGPAKESPQDKLTFRVAVFVYRGDEALDKEVSLKANGQQVNEPAPVLSTDPNGRALFQVSLDKDATECWLVAEVEGKSYSYLWQKGVEIDPLLRKKMIEEPKPELTNLVVRCRGNAAEVKAVDREGNAVPADLTITPRLPGVVIQKLGGEEVKTQPISIPAGVSTFFFFHPTESKFRVDFSGGNLVKTGIIYPKKQERNHG